MPGAVSEGNEHVISVFAQNDELLIWLETELTKLVKVDRRSIVTLPKDITRALVSSLSELRLPAAHPVAIRLIPERLFLLRAVQSLEHVPPAPHSFLETRRWQAKEALVIWQVAIEAGDCDVKMVDIKVEGLSQRI